VAKKARELEHAARVKAGKAADEGKAKAEGYKVDFFYYSDPLYDRGTDKGDVRTLLRRKLVLPNPVSNRRTTPPRPPYLPPHATVKPA
jgi:hypothetical protein